MLVVVVVVVAVVVVVVVLVGVRVAVVVARGSISRGVKEGKREVSPPTHPARRQGRRIPMNKPPIVNP